MDVAHPGQPPGVSWCKTCGEKCRQVGTHWRHMSATPSGVPHDHNAVPGAPKPSARPGVEFEVTLRVRYSPPRVLAFADDGVTAEQLPREIAGRLADAVLELGCDGAVVVTVQPVS